ncbi:N-acetylglucosamine kinase [Kribbella sp. NPDC048928]|uniref:N-acetylglucosamine kinase n=1 Tax=Kribbella sp. NPDC048928 TaxID=3364111 RepID=UPI00371972C0
MTEVFLAVDAGNTKTWAGLTTADGELVGLVRGGIGDIYAPAGPEAAKAVVLGLVGELLDGAGLRPGDVRHSAFRLAGVDWPEDAQFWTAALRELFDVGSFSVKNDGFALIRSGRLDGQGISVVLGTGAALAGRGPAKEWALSWWLQHPLGGQGLVSEALRAVYLSQLGLAQPTKLSAVLPSVFGASTPEEMLEATTHRGNPSTFATLAAHAPAVLALIDEDPVVAGLVDTQADRIADYCLSLIAACGLADDATVVVGGGLVREPGAPLYEALRRTCERRGLSLDVRHTQDPALVGALLDAIAEGGATPTEAARRRLSAATW